MKIFNLFITGIVSFFLSFQLFAATECKPSKWGKDDTLGSANLVSPENTLKAAKLIKKGKSQPLGIVIDSSTPAFPPRSLSLQVFSPNQNGGKKLNQFGYPAQYADDVLQTWLGIGSQIDGLGHLGEAGLYYNCADEKEIIMTTGLTKYGVHDIPPLVGRRVVLDMAKKIRQNKDNPASGALMHLLMPIVTVVARGAGRTTRVSMPFIPATQAAANPYNRKINYFERIIDKKSDKISK